MNKPIIKNLPYEESIYNFNKAHFDYINMTLLKIDGNTVITNENKPDIALKRCMTIKITLNSRIS